MTSTVASVLNLQSALGVKFITNPRRLKKKKKNPLSVTVHPLYFLISPGSV